MRKLFKGGNYSRAETIRGNTVYKKCFGNNSNLHIPKVGISGGIAVLERINMLAKVDIIVSVLYRRG